MTTIRQLLIAAVCLAAAVQMSSEVAAQGWINPEIYNSGRRVTDARYDPFTGRIIVRTDQTKVRESYLDPNRNVIDPGSYRRVNRYETDLNGVRWHVTGEQWTSNGVPHGNLSRRRIVRGGGGGGVVEDRNEHVAFGVQEKGSQQRTSPQPRNRQQPQQRSNPSRRGSIDLRNFNPF